MVAWVVINRQHLRPTPPCFSPCPIPVSELTPPSSQKKSPLSFHALAWNLFCNPFVFKFMHGMGGYTPFPTKKKEETYEHNNRKPHSRRRSGRSLGKDRYFSLPLPLSQRQALQPPRLAGSLWHLSPPLPGQHSHCTSSARPERLG